jgi:hypothetical protein
MPIGSDARFPLNTDPSIVPAQPAMRMLDNPPAAAPAATPMAATAAPGAGVGFNPLGGVMSFLASLFGGGGGAATGAPAATPGPAQGMRGLLQQPVGRGAPGTNTLGNPVGRF